MAFDAQPIFPGDLFDSGMQISETVNQSLSKAESETARVRALESAWATAQDLGWTVAAIPEALGGVGGGFDDVAAIAEGLARGGAAMSVADPCLVTPSLLLAAGAPGAEALGRIANGDARIVSALAASRVSSAPDAAGASVDAVGDRVVLRGARYGVDAGIGATHYLVLASRSAATAAESALVLAPRRSPGLTEKVFRRPDGRYCADLQFDGVSLPATALLASGSAVREALERASNLGVLVGCVEAVSAMAEIVGQTIDYLSTRKQFGVTLSTFQALRHRVADMYVAYENARAATQRGIAALQEDVLRSSRDVSLARINVGEASRFVAQSAIQLHGGMGMTEDLKAARLAKRVLLADFEFGDRHHHMRRARAGARDADSSVRTEGRPT